MCKPIPEAIVRQLALPIRTCYIPFHGQILESRRLQGIHFPNNGAVKNVPAATARGSKKGKGESNAKKRKAVKEKGKAKKGKAEEEESEASEEEAPAKQAKKQRR